MRNQCSGCKFNDRGGECDLYGEYLRNRWGRGGRQGRFAWVKYVVAFLVGLVLFGFAHYAATAARGYEAVGGEFFLLLAPLALYLGSLWSRGSGGAGGGTDCGNKDV